MLNSIEVSGKTEDEAIASALSQLGLDRDEVSIEIIERAKSQCNLVWLENLNLRGDYRKRILDWVHEKHPELDGLYQEIYSRKSRAYWTELDQKIREYTEKEGMLYIRDDDQHRAPFGEPPVVCNYLYHEEITK